MVDLENIIENKNDVLDDIASEMKSASMESITQRK